MEKGTSILVLVIFLTVTGLLETALTAYLWIIGAMVAFCALAFVYGVVSEQLGAFKRHLFPTKSVIQSEKDLESYLRYCRTK